MEDIVTHGLPHSRGAMNSRGNNESGGDGDDAYADIEDEVTPFKMTGPVKHRSNATNILHVCRPSFSHSQCSLLTLFKGNVRDHLFNLMKRENSESPFTGITVENDGDVTSFNPHNGPCCTAENFRVNLNGNPKDPWNASAANVFVSDFIGCGTYACKNVEKIKGAFFVHLKSLKRVFKKRQLDAVTIADAKRKAKRYQRKRNVGNDFLDCIPYIL
jgi:hypothetical protein